ncbi:MAG: hypothetical protein H8M99_10140 [Gloeobacteraceae cyanobacterium ES-bin-144]|nr:hypothetical protein [Verrucomicrobiales bacterium]
MSTNRGIFESFPSQPTTRQESPFAVVSETVAEQPAAAPSPFGAAPRQESPFSVVDDGAEASAVEFGRPTKLPDRRKMESPFQVAEPSEGFGFEAPAKAFGASPFEAPAAAPAPFSTPVQQPPPSPFAPAEPARGPSNPTQAAIAAFTNWQEPASTATVPQAFAPAPPAAPFEAPAPVPVPAAFAPAPQTPVRADDIQSDSLNIRQLELRAIFGVDREMNADEILQRSRALPGMRNIGRVGVSDMATIDALKNLLPSLGFGSGALKLYSGSVPLEFIREGSVMLAVQTDGGFAPGVRETLMIVARELNRMG